MKERRKRTDEGDWRKFFAEGESKRQFRGGKRERITYEESGKKEEGKVVGKVCECVYVYVCALAS